MEQRDLEQIEKYVKVDPTLRNLYEEHKLLEKRIAKLAKKPFLTVSEQKEEHRLKKLKLVGKDRMMQILLQHREKSL